MQNYKSEQNWQITSSKASAVGNPDDCAGRTDGVVMCTAAFLHGTQPLCCMCHTSGETARGGSKQKPHGLRVGSGFSTHLPLSSAHFSVPRLRIVELLCLEKTLNIIKSKRHLALLPRPLNHHPQCHVPVSLPAGLGTPAFPPRNSSRYLI